MMKECEYNPNLSAYIDGELSADDQESMARHIDSCDVCRNELSLLRETDMLLSGLDAVSPSESFDRDFWKKLEASTRPKRNWSLGNLFRLWQPYAAAALTAMVIVAVVFSGKPERYTPGPNELIIATNFELFDEYDVIDNIDLLENWDVIETVGEGT